MSLPPGTRLGPYEIQSALGAGGMGEVYRARDTRLDRTVAIKVLPEALASDAQFRERFDREARVISSLNHPHICTLHDVGREQNTDFLVMEYLEGETLEQRLARAAIPLEQAMEMAVQIADALAAAHRAGVVHRDLKPANIVLVRRAGRSGPPDVKLLDFGLAKTGPAKAGPHVHEGVGAGFSRPGETMLPTTPAGLTHQGTILGTFQYMAPEQVEGQEADARSDIFAFGCVLYEMVTRRRAFEGKTAASVMAAILERTPPAMPSLQPLTPPLLDHIVARCLVKNPDERWQTASDVLQELKWLTVSGSQVGAATPARQVGGRRLAIWGAALGLAAGVAAASLFWFVMRPAPQSSQPVARLTIELPAAAQRAVDNGVVVARDGRTFVYSALGDDGVTRLYARRLAQLESVPIRGTENASNATLSPDATWVAFAAAGQLKKVALGGGPPVVLCDVPEGVFGTDWSPDDTIVFGGPTGLARVPAAGGRPELIVKTDPSQKEAGHRWPHVLADGRTIVFTIWFGGSDTSQVAIASLDTGERRTLAQGAYPKVTASGHLLFTRVRSLWAVQLDRRSLAIIGEPIPVLEGVQTQINGRSMFDVAPDGSLVYQQAGLSGGGQRLVWLDRTGQLTPVADERLAGIYHPSPRLSPDGRFLAVTIHPEGGDDQIVVYNLERGIQTPIGTGPRMNSRWPVWTPDGTRITFGSTRAGTWDLYSVPAAGGPPEPLLVREDDQYPLSWSPDGRVLAFRQPGRPAGFDIWLLPRGGEPSPFIVTPFEERSAAFSPDGRWFAYDSNESGRFEVYVRPYPGPGERIRVSTNGGTEPVWARSGAELFYRQGDRALMAVSVRGGPSLQVGAPAVQAQIQLDTEGGTNYDVSPDGRRFVAIENLDTTSASIVIVQNWLEELRQRVPAN